MNSKNKMPDDQSGSRQNWGIFASIKHSWGRLKPQQGVLLLASVFVLYFAWLAQASLLFMIISIACLLSVALWDFNSENAKAEQMRFANRKKTMAQSAMRYDDRKSAKALIDAIEAPIYIVDDKLKILYHNKIADDVFKRGELGNYFNVQFRNPELLAAITEVFAKDRNVKLEYQTSSDRDDWYLVEIAPIPPFFVDKPIGVMRTVIPKTCFIIFRDITQAHAVERMRSDFIANASHELRTPLASVSGYIDTLLGAAKNDEKAREQFLKIMQKDTARMSRLIDDLLSLSKIEMQRNVIYKDTVDLKSILEQVIATLKPVADGFDVTLHLQYKEGDHRVLGSHDGLVQVFQNLIENACKYGQSGGKVDVRIENHAQDKGAISVSVKDYGSGIEEHHLPRLTERFYRVDVETSRANKGTGLGLAIVKHILNQHDADLAITSKLNEGANFTVNFHQIAKYKNVNN